MVEPEIPTAEEMLIQEKEQLFMNDVEAGKARQRTIIAQCDSEISYMQEQVNLYTGRKEAAQKLLDELEARFPTEEPE